jgi:uncharacterized protein YpmB
MAKLSIQKRHQQFALILLLIVVIVGVAFTVWYFNEKKSNATGQQNTIPAASQRDSYNPADITAAD